jgi:hypothetical protein
MERDANTSLLERILDFNNMIIGSSGVAEQVARIVYLLPSILLYQRAAVYRYDESTSTVHLIAVDESGN